MLYLYFQIEEDIDGNKERISATKEN